MTPAQTTEALRRESLCVQAEALIAAGASFNETARQLGEPTANLHRYLKTFRAGGFAALAPQQAGHSGAQSVRQRFVAQLGEEAVAEIEKKVAGLALDLSGSIAGGSRRLSDGLAWRTIARVAATARAGMRSPARGSHARSTRSLVMCSLRMTRRLSIAGGWNGRGPKPIPTERNSCRGSSCQWPMSRVSTYWRTL
jgi:hypothetical protein